MALEEEFADDFNDGSDSTEGLAHGWRTAAWCREIGSGLGLPASDVDALERAGVLLPAMLGEESFDADEDPKAVELYQVHKQGRKPQTTAIKTLVRILEDCEHLDNACEFDALVPGAESGLTDWIEVVARYLRRVTEGDVDSVCRDMPVFPAVAERAISALSDDRASFAELEQLISLDAVIAGNVLLAANSALMPATKVETIRDALTRIGVRRAREVICASSLRSLFGVRHCERLWNHSLAVAEMTSEIVRLSGGYDPARGFLAGLVHDVGQIVMAGMPAAVCAQRDGLSRRGCPDVVVERVLFGASHARIGARVLRGWSFSGEIVAAVTHHHEPEQCGSVLSAALYLAEVVAGRDAGLMSASRQRLALGLLKLNSLESLKMPGTDSPYAGLAYAAA